MRVTMTANTTDEVIMQVAENLAYIRGMMTTKEGLKRVKRQISKKWKGQ